MYTVVKTVAAAARATIQESGATARSQRPVVASTGVISHRVRRAVMASGRGSVHSHLCRQSASSGSRVRKTARTATADHARAAPGWPILA